MKGQSLSLRNCLILGLSVSIIAFIVIASFGLKALNLQQVQQQKTQQASILEARISSLNQILANIIDDNSSILLAETVEELPSQTANEYYQSFLEQLKTAESIIIQSRSNINVNVLEALRIQLFSLQESSKNLLKKTHTNLLTQEEIKYRVNEIDKKIEDTTTVATRLATELTFKVDRTNKQLFRDLRKKIRQENIGEATKLSQTLKKTMYGSLPKARTNGKKMHEKILELTTLSRKAMLTKDDDELLSLKNNELQKLTGDIDNYIIILLQQLENEADILSLASTFIDNYRPLHALIIGSDNSLFNLKANLFVERHSLDQTRQDVQSKRSQLYLELNTLSADVGSWVNELSIEANQQGEKHTATLLIITSVMAFIIFFGGLLLIRRIAGPINEITQQMQDIASGDGDLTGRINIKRKDELGQLAIQFNTFVERIQQIVIQGKNSAAQVNSTAQQLVTSAASSEKRVTEQQQSINKITDSIADMSSSLQTVTQHINGVSDATQSANKNTIDGMQELDISASHLQVITSEVELCAEIIEQLSKDSKSIGTVLNVIEQISDQTNLLALNAAIEAARAGDTGRGFAVVADEVRELAKKAQQSTVDIKSMIEDLRSRATSAKEQMTNNQKTIDKTVQQTKLSDDAFRKVAIKISDISTMSKQVASTTEEQSIMSSVVHNNIAAIKVQAEETAAEIQSSVEHCQSLMYQADELKKVVGQFKVK
ncbi:MAG: methyl-accepting chemotaxis protein [Colwellia sp.]|jgi:methyl-accepting chemotaxis protein